MNLSINENVKTTLLNHETFQNLKQVFKNLQNLNALRSKTKISKKYLKILQ